ncbi:MAG: site-specific integrase [Candidatus Acidiferrum sp.]
MAKAKVVLCVRVNDSTGKFPTLPVETKRNAVRLPIEYRGKVYMPDAILGFYARYPHIAGHCLFPGCTGRVKRHVQGLGKDHVDAYSVYQRIERDFFRVREGKLPVEPQQPMVRFRSLEEEIAEFETSVRNKQRKARTIQSYLTSLGQFQTFCASGNVTTVHQICKDTILGFVGWLQANLKTRVGGHPNNTYRNKLKDVRVFLIDAGVGMPLKPKDWPKEVRARKEKYSVDAVKRMLAAADTIKRHDNNPWSAEDDKDLVHFFLKTGFRDDEAAHAQYSDVDFENGTVNVTSKPRGTFPGYPEIAWTPKNNSAREKDIIIDEGLLKRLENRKQRYGAKSSSLIFPNRDDAPSQHLIRVVQRLAKAAGVEGRIGLHKFRKTFATLVANEEGIEVARLLLGHEDVVTTQRYLAADEATPKQDRKRVKKMFAAFGD